MMTSPFTRLIAQLASITLSDRACNQYSRIEGDLRGNAMRRRNLRLYFEQLAEIRPRILLVGEAPSYRGGRLTGIPFVSETILLSGVETRSGLVLGGTRGFRKATAGPRLSTEASATMVWQTIRDIEPLPILWNAFPFHPFHRGNPQSNRVPSSAELLIGQPFIRDMIAVFEIEQVAAVGNQAAASLTRLGIAHEKVRHPSQGGKQKFVAGMARLSQGGKGMTRKSQIQEIKEGRAMREKTYNNRNQPSGPPAPLPTKNAVKLSTVPSSAAEKYKGGRDD
jgi:uracil-DNA glycosylase